MGSGTKSGRTSATLAATTMTATVAATQTQRIANARNQRSTTTFQGYDIEYNLYGENEYTVQYNGDDMWFQTEDEAKNFIRRRNRNG